jgi:hypothetical protein
MIKFLGVITALILALFLATGCNALFFPSALPDAAANPTINAKRTTPAKRLGTLRLFFILITSTCEQLLEKNAPRPSAATAALSIKGHKKATRQPVALPGWLYRRHWSTLRAPALPLTPG